MGGSSSIPMTALPARKKWEECRAHRGDLRNRIPVCAMRRKTIAGTWIGPCPARCAGGIQQWFGTCTDIEDQKHNQQILEAADQRTDRGAGRRQHSPARGDVGEGPCAQRHSNEQNEQMMQRTDRALAAGHAAGQDGRIAAELPEQEEVFAAALGLCAQDFSRPSRRRRAVQFRSESGRSGWLLARLPASGHGV